MPQRGVYRVEERADVSSPWSRVTRRPLFEGPRRERALDIAADVLVRSIARIERAAQADGDAAEHLRGAVLVAHALSQAGRAPAPDARALLPRTLVFSPARHGLHDGAAGLLVMLDALDPRRTAFGRARVRLREALIGALREAPRARLRGDELRSDRGHGGPSDRARGRRNPGRSRTFAALRKGSRARSLFSRSRRALCRGRLTRSGAQNSLGGVHRAERGVLGEHPPL
jgi:hypothetical protein